MDDFMRPPEPGMVLHVCRWSDVFETSHSRGYKTLRWIAHPVALTSAGFLELGDTFEDPRQSLALYGAWSVLTKIAAAAPVRGYLASHGGKPYSCERLARLSGIGSAELFGELISWALTGNKEGRFEWLEWSHLPNVGSENTGNQVDVLPTEVALPQRVLEKVATGHNRTGHDMTKPSGPVGAGPGNLDRNQSQPWTDWVCEQLNSKSETTVEPIPGVKAPRRCWTRSAGWDDRFIAELNSREVTAVQEALNGLWLWFCRQLAAPDPVVPETTAAAAVAVIAVGMEAAKRSGIKNRVAWFRDTLTRRQTDRLPEDQKHLKAAANFVQKAARG